MATFNLSVTTGIGITDSNAQDKKSTSVLDCIANDLDVVDGRVVTQITRKGASTYNPLQGTVTTVGDNTMVVVATRTMVTQRDLQQANSFYRVGDIKYRLAANDCEFIPVQGDILLREGIEHEILGIDITAMETSYLLWTRHV